MPAVRKIVLVNTSDAGGGAERVSMDLLDGFAALGTDAWLAVAEKRTQHPRVVSFYTSPHVDYRPKRRFDRTRLQARRRLDGRIGLEDFNHPYTRHLIELTGSPPDVVLCNNLHGGYFDLRQLRPLSRRLPIVLRLADGWSFTGHCAVPGSCDRWRTGCGHCPDLAAPPSISRDASRMNWRRKRRIYAHSRVFVIAPSRWMLERARASMLAPSIARARVIPNGVDLGTFTPDGNWARRSDPGPPRLVFAANAGAANPHKDFETIRAALRMIDGPLELVSVGGKGGVEELGGGIRIRHMPELTRTRLAALYRSATAYVHASAEESFGLTSAEALACGTPVVAASRGGLSEVVDDGINGFIHPPGDADGLAGSVRRLIADPELRARMGASAASRGAAFDRDRMVRNVHEFCTEAIEAWRTHP
ncbi:MAG TPA: glycosyltransferase [Solirubrobacterales bacterium]|jgi:glycosyltransferase involved in cell wall biosynthesis